MSKEIQNNEKPIPTLTLVQNKTNTTKNKTIPDLFHTLDNFLFGGQIFAHVMPKPSFCEKTTSTLLCASIENAKNNAALQHEGYTYFPETKSFSTPRNLRTHQHAFKNRPGQVAQLTCVTLQRRKAIQTPPPERKHKNTLNPRHTWCVASQEAASPFI